MSEIFTAHLKVPFKLGKIPHFWSLGKRQGLDSYSFPTAMAQKYDLEQTNEVLLFRTQGLESMLQI